mmetsp:Transcript_14399/g.33279  ORF Transcript_14399/g.33279 Transcript_14399/m.33279 type:complete len:288 (+) Transcript_14399:158-1021(+)
MPAMTLPFEQVDAFTTKPFAGNPAAVMRMPGGKFLSDDLLTKIAAENNLSETAYWCPKAGAPKGEYELRWFTPTVEVVLCGHATLATAHSIFSSKEEDAPNPIFFHTKSGRLTVERSEDGRMMMELPTWPQANSPGLIEGVGAALGIAPKETYWTPIRRDALAVFEYAQQIADLKPDLQQLRALPPGGLICSAPGPAPDGQACDFVYRFFAPSLGIDEDPACGSAQCSLVPYWAGRLGKNDFSSLQLSQRGAELLGCLVPSAGADSDRVLVRGSAVTVIRGEMYLPS